MPRGRLKPLRRGAVGLLACLFYPIKKESQGVSPAVPAVLFVSGRHCAHQELASLALFEKFPAFLGWVCLSVCLCSL